MKNMDDKAKNFAVVLADEHDLIGHIVFHKYFGEHTYEIGWVFNPKFHNKGFASEAALAVLKFGFENYEITPDYSHLPARKYPILSSNGENGMRREGYFKKCIPHGNEWWDEYYYAILREEWERD